MSKTPKNKTKPTRESPTASQAETPAEKYCRIKALVDGYIAKGGPITKEQLTDEIRKFGKTSYWATANQDNNFRPYTDGKILDLFLALAWPSAEAIERGVAFWNKADAEHAKWLADMQSQTTPITPEQEKMLRDGDSWYYYNPVIKSISECVKLTAINADQSFGRYFTRAAAQAALDKDKDNQYDLIQPRDEVFVHNGHKWEYQGLVRFLYPNEVGKPRKTSVINQGGNTYVAENRKDKLARYQEQHSYMDDAQYAACVEARDWAGADLRAEELDKAKTEAEPLEWCEREKGDIVKDGDEVSDMRKEFDLQALGYACRSVSDSWTKASGWLGCSVGEVAWGDYIIRARYRNPLWLAKHGKEKETKPTTTPEKPCDMPDTLTISGKSYRLLKDWEDHDLSKGDLPVSGSQTHRFGSVWYRPIASRETPVGETQAKEVVTDETQSKVGNKYHRTIHGMSEGSLVVDVYNVLDAFGVTCPSCQHAIKKLLCTGLRNKGSRLQDLTEAETSVRRAVELEQQRTLS